MPGSRDFIAASWPTWIRRVGDAKTIPELMAILLQLCRQLPAESIGTHPQRLESLEDIEQIARLLGGAAKAARPGWERLGVQRAADTFQFAIVVYQRLSMVPQEPASSTRH